MSVEIREGVRFGDGRLGLIAGPCVIEGRDHCLKMAEAVAEASSNRGIACVFKASYDKANRTSVDSFRGPGLDEGLAILEEVRDATGLPVLTDVHQPEQASAAAAAVDVLQIPAFLCRQTDLVLAAARTGLPVNIKKGQFLAPWDLRHVVDKARSTGNRRVLLTERGTCFGYNNLVVDFKSLPVMAGLGCPVVFDVTHSLQLPGGGNGETAGQAEFAPVLAAAAVAAGADAVFIEVHDDPPGARSDAATQLPLERLGGLLDRLIRIHDASASPRSVTETAGGGSVGGTPNAAEGR